MGKKNNIQKNCRIQFSNSNEALQCKINFLNDQKVLQIEYQLAQKKVSSIVENNLFKQTTAYIELSLNLSVYIIKNYNNQPKNLNYIRIVIQDIKTLQKTLIQIQTSNMENDFETFYKYFRGVVWMKGQIHKKYQLVLQLPRGDYNTRTYYLVKDKQTQQQHYIKKYYKHNYLNEKKTMDISSILKEVQLQNYVIDKNIMHFSQFHEDNQYFYLFYKQLPTSCVAKCIVQAVQLTPTSIKGIITQILKALLKLFKKGIVHNNINPYSIFLIEKDNKYRTCLGEFQGSYKYSNKEISSKPYQKISKGQENASKKDIYDLGLLIYQMLFRKPLFKNNAKKGSPQTYQYPQINFRTNEFNILSPKCLDLFKQMLQTCPEKRISIEQALQHQYLNNNILQEKVKFYGNSDVKTPEFHKIPSQKFFNDVRQKMRIKRAQMVNIDDFYNDNDAITRINAIDCQIETYQMDDSHMNFHLKDIRTMVPSWKKQRSHIFNL